MVVAAAWTFGQTPVTQPPGQTGLKPMDLVAPTVISGPDLGFRVESIEANVPVGKLVVRIKGVWVDAQISPSGIMAAPSANR
jgi:hypothetical protein